MAWEQRTTALSAPGGQISPTGTPGRLCQFDWRLFDIAGMKQADFRDGGPTGDILWTARIDLTSENRQRWWTFTPPLEFGLDIYVTLSATGKIETLWEEEVEDAHPYSLQSF